MTAIKDAINDGYDVTVREICQALKCSRAFHNEHIRRYYPHIYVNPALARDLAKARLISSPGSTLYDRHALDAMAAGGVVRRRSKRVWLTEALPPEAHDGLVTRLEAIGEAYGEPDWIRRAMAIRAARDSLADYVNENALPDWRRAVGSTRWVRARTKASWHELGDRPPIGLAWLAGWRTPAAMKDYGDTDEDVARQIWKRGDVQLTITLPDETERVMYALDPTPMPMAPALEGLEDSPAALHCAAVAMAVEVMPYIP